MLENFARWCSGSTIVFGAIRIGSNPVRVTIKRNVEESGLSRHIWDVEHAGSNPAIPTDMVRTTQHCD